MVLPDFRHLSTMFEEELNGSTHPIDVMKALENLDAHHTALLSSPTPSSSISPIARHLSSQGPTLRIHMDAKTSFPVVDKIDPGERVVFDVPPRQDNAEEGLGLEETGSEGYGAAGELEALRERLSRRGWLEEDELQALTTAPHSAQHHDPPKRPPATAGPRATAVRPAHECELLNGGTGSHAFLEALSTAWQLANSKARDFISKDLDTRAQTCHEAGTVNLRRIIDTSLC
ncbi:hypothetical protein BDK51DRAFT_37184 [Blyttiomyces helicus]|uniref:Uncharacterized protein n=1 Tax=Blyttiomyces helicus TaxID=388810 RepID=A0A4V1IRP0_9FUNG|nr:hypothetical protein BDK51DRAFT_37184 [Blyttiomyces helicus]|eukprot:RKO90727.1 hypothetical protein BDK51DRAFT_37184 [Blyttiomyces helicus]